MARKAGKFEDLETVQRVRLSPELDRDDVTAQELADVLGVSRKYAIRLCKKLGVKVSYAPHPELGGGPRILLHIGSWRLG